MSAACLTLTLEAAAQTRPDTRSAAQSTFRRGLTALHNFEYEEANAAFQEARRIDPAFVLAYWGEAMTYHQMLWRREDVLAGRQALARLGGSSAARAAQGATPKEAGLLEAAEVLFGDGDVDARRRAYVAKMAHLHERFPDDPDIAALYALGLLATVSRGLIGFSEPQAVSDHHVQGLAGSDVQKQVADLLNGVLASHPQHPGALHYLLHAYDDPEHARLALPAARAYAKVAGGASHALHMPAHIFVQLGFWHDAARSDRAAYDASSDWVRRKNLGPAMRNYHALSWLQYELLQLGRYREAWQAIEELEPVVAASGALIRGGPLLSDLSSMRARYVIETRRWDLLASAQNFGNVDELYAIGCSAARANNLDGAERVRRVLAERAKAEQEGDVRPAIAIMERELAALIALARGRRDEALGILQTAARDEIALPLPLGPPLPIKPAPELLGEVLLDSGRPREAAEAFAQVLRRSANRSLSLLGLARTTVALGDLDASRRYYRELLANFDHADPELTEVKEARAALAGADIARAPAPRPRRASFAVSAALATALMLIVGRRRRRLESARPKGRAKKRAERTGMKT